MVGEQLVLEVKHLSTRPELPRYRTLQTLIPGVMWQPSRIVRIVA
jgi:hypothetical protein